LRNVLYNYLWLLVWVLLLMVLQSVIKLSFRLFYLIFIISISWFTQIMSWLPLMNVSLLNLKVIYFLFSIVLFILWIILYLINLKIIRLIFCVQLRRKKSCLFNPLLLNLIPSIWFIWSIVSIRNLTSIIIITTWLPI
jgi:hypothetical protein